MTALRYDIISNKRVTPVKMLPRHQVNDHWVNFTYLHSQFISVRPAHAKGVCN
jgi:hypothetical protein